MSIESSSNSVSVNTCEVTSKYFCTLGVMDESLTEFQEKKIFATKKTKTQKPSTSSKPKPKKNLKRIRGQKDIRSVLKKNELVEYTNDFDKICKQSGIDVDSEQLQLAIALSKSLKETEGSEDNSPCSSESLTTQERTGKIRTTLQEYGFVVPEIKITKKKRAKKYKKPYKLLLTVEEEKNQIISDRYSQVLFQNFDSTNNSSSTVNNSSNFFYHKATNILYEEVKNNNLFYVDNLLEKSGNCVGCLLKDWSKIPGRPISPTFGAPEVKFERIDCSQEELDIFLSGTLKSIQELVRSKYTLLPSEDHIPAPLDKNNLEKENHSVKMDDDCEIIEPECANKTAASCVLTDKKLSPKSLDEEANILTVTQNQRSCSPDLFEDDVSEVIDISVEHTDVLVTQKLSRTHDVMDLTKCVTQSHQTLQPISQSSQGTNQTKRKTNDFMDITECVIGSSQAIRENVIVEENIDLTQNSDKEDNVIMIPDKNKTVKEIQSLDLTQSSDSNEELPEVQLRKEKSLDNTIIVNESYSEYRNEENFCSETNNPKNACLSVNKINLDTVDTIVFQKLQSSGDLDKHPVINVNDEEVDSHIDKEVSLQCRAISPIDFLGSCNDNFEFHDKSPTTHLTDDLPSQNEAKSPNLTEKNQSKSKTDSFFDEFVYRHSDSSMENTDNVLCKGDISSSSLTNDRNNIEKRPEDIDLTQESGSSKDTNEETDKPNFIDKNNLGNEGDVSIDYDEIYDGMIQNNASTSHACSVTSRPNTVEYDITKTEKPSTIDLVANLSQNSEVFEISDNELNYSVTKARQDCNNPPDNYDFGGISVVDNLPDLPSFRQSTNYNKSLNRSMSDSCLPVVSVKNNHNHSNQATSCSSVSVSPKKFTRAEMLAKTPKSTEYIIKTDNVTPMLEYEKMSTPERNEELSKYGLKPFKRKRAIQLLTHLYNQTHPIVECLEDLPSPTKKFKSSSQKSPLQTCPEEHFNSTQTQSIQSQKNAKSPRKNNSREPSEFGVLADKENIYEVTNEVPDIGEIECCEEDWIFQKKEKAKLHSCRVPLHIAFHNYVWCRRRLAAAILRYEPVNIDVIHRGLADSGHKYDPKDLLKFMDKKCITVKTADNTGKNKKHY